MQDVIIIGGGAAGLTAAVYAARYGFSPVVIERLFSGGQLVNIHEIENYSGFDDPVSGVDLAMKMERQAKKAGTEILYGEITSVSLTGDIKTVTTKKQTYEARTVILAAGAKRRQLGLANEQRLTGAGVSYCATCDGALYKGKSVLIVGGGDTAFTDALFLSKYCPEVILIHRRDTFRAQAELVDKVKNHENITLMTDSVVAEILEADGKVRGVKVQNTQKDEAREVLCEGIFVAVGYEPQTDWLQGQLRLDADGYIITDETMRASLPGVYAAGDIRQKPLRQIITSAADGAVAAYSCAQDLSD